MKTGEGTMSMISADIKLLSSAILNILKTLNELGKKPSLKGKGGVKRPSTSQKTDNHVSAKKPNKEGSSSVTK